MTAHHSLLSPYLSALSRLAPLTPEEEHQLAQKAKRGDMQAKMVLIQRNLRLVIKIAKEYKHRGVALEDLIEEGNLGLIWAVEKFDPDKGCRLSTYAVWWIREHIEKCILNQAHLIRLPAHVMKEANHVSQADQALTQQLQHTPKDKEIACMLDCKTDRVQKIQAIVDQTKTYSLDGMDSSASLEAEVPDVSQIVGQEELSKLIQSFLKELRPHEKDVIVRRFGLQGHEPHTLEATSAILGVTKERVRQIQLSALKRLRYILAGVGIQDGSFDVH